MNDPLPVVKNPLRGEIWWIDLDPAKGTEKQKLRPCLIMSRDSYSSYPQRIIVPITSWRDKFASRPWMIFIAASFQNGLDNDSGIDCFQVRCVDITERIADYVGKLPLETVDRVAITIARSIGYDPI